VAVLNGPDLGRDGVEHPIGIATGVVTRGDLHLAAVEEHHRATPVLVADLHRQRERPARMRGQHPGGPSATACRCRRLDEQP